MRPQLTALMLIGGLVVLGLLAGVGLVLVSRLRERRHTGGPRSQDSKRRQRHRAA